MRTVLTCILVMLATTLLAQHHTPSAEQKEKIAAYKVAFITERLDLTVEESQKFWPVFNEMENKMEALDKEKKMGLMEGRMNFEEMTDEEVNAFVDKQLDFRQQELDIQREYVAKFREMLPAKKVAKLLKAQHEFRHHLLKMIQRRGEGGPRGGGGPRHRGGGGW